MVLTPFAAGMERRALPGALLEMTYQNDSGEVSRRRVRVVKWIHGKNGFSYLRGWCFLRGEERTFRADRILDWQVEESALTAAIAAVPVRAVPVLAVPVPAAWTPAAIGRPAPVLPAAAVPVLVSGACAPAPQRRRRGGRGVLGVVGAGVAVFIIRSIALGGSQPAPAPRPVVVPAPRTVPRAVPRAVPRVVPRAVPRPTPAPAPAPKPLQADTAAAAVRAAAFRAATGIASERLAALYEQADTGADGSLDWRELAAFQSRITRDYAYLSNEPALRPDEFLQQGGGDCEDWALFTCGLLRYWGWDPWVGRLAPTEQGDGHAVCMARLAEKPARYAWWHVDGDGTMGGFPVKEGWYVPIDYDHVGELSNAVGEGWKLRALWRPESIYGERM